MDNRQYRPSNGTEGAAFIEKWCGTCARDKVCSEGKDIDECTDDELCDILAKTFVFELDNPNYPGEWVYDQHGRPYCMAWISAGEQVPIRCNKTADMFDEEKTT